MSLPNNRNEFWAQKLAIQSGAPRNGMRHSMRDGLWVPNEELTYEGGNPTMVFASGVTDVTGWHCNDNTFRIAGNKAYIPYANSSTTLHIDPLDEFGTAPDGPATEAISGIVNIAWFLSLVNLIVPNNKITGFVWGNGYGPIPYLSYVDIHNNPIQGQLDFFNMNGVPTLETLIAHHCGLTKMPVADNTPGSDSADGFAFLKYLDLHDNNIQGPVDMSDWSFDANDYPEYIDLNNNPNIGLLELTSGRRGSLSTLLTTPCFSFRNCGLSSANINGIFTSLGTAGMVGHTIDVAMNPGSAACTPGIAEAKDWTVVR